MNLTHPHSGLQQIVVVQSLRVITPDQEKTSVGATVDKPALSSAAQSGKATYTTSCLVCHGSGVAGAPTISDKATWENRLKQGMNTVIKHAIEGFSGEKGVMPPKGGNASLTDEQVADAVHYMLEAQEN